KQRPPQARDSDGQQEIRRIRQYSERVRLREDRRGSRGSGLAFQATPARTSVGGAAGNSGGSPEGAPRGAGRDHEGSGIPRRGQPGRTRHRPCIAGGSGGAAQAIRGVPGGSVQEGAGGDWALTLPSLPCREPLLVSGPRQFDRRTTAQSTTLLVDPLGDRHISRRGPVVVGMECDLIVAGAPGE